jgi:hypothetical protein|tara:strand:- start:2758 stop:2892 length:135 start_codon:yes stop_codon:yes gene_type:complete
MKAFVAALVAIALVAGMAAIGLGTLDSSSETLFAGDDVRLSKSK